MLYFVLYEILFNYWAYLNGFGENISQRAHGESFGIYCYDFFLFQVDTKYSDLFKYGHIILPKCFILRSNDLGQYN